MAVRPVFISDGNHNDFVKVENIDFTWFPGFSISQKQKSVQSLHHKVLERYPNKNILEVSSKQEPI